MCFLLNKKMLLHYCNSSVILKGFFNDKYSHTHANEKCIKALQSPIST